MKNTDPKTNIIFATPLYFKDVENPLLNNELLKYCLSLKKKRKGRKISNVGGWQSDDVDCEHKTIVKFIDYIQSDLSEYMRLFNDNQQFRINNMWFNINSKHHYNQEHSHEGGISNVDFSGVYYLKTSNNEKCGSIVFNNPDNKLGTSPLFSLNEIKEYSPFNSSKYISVPKDQRLLLFQSHIKHSVLPNRTSKDRISLAFNWSVV